MELILNNHLASLLSLLKCYTCGQVLKVIIDLWILFDGKVLEVFYRAKVPVTKKLRHNQVSSLGRSQNISR